MIRKKLAFILTVYLTTLILMALQKPVFLLYYSDLAAGCSPAEWFEVILHGLKLDLTVAGYITALPLLLTLLTLWITLPERLARWIYTLYFSLISVITALIFAVDIELYEHWGFRIDSTILMYLTDPSTALASVDWVMGLRQTFFFAVWTALMILAYRRFAIPCGDNRRLPLRLSAAVWTPVLLLLGGLDFLAIRGGVGASVANISKVYFSSNLFLNHAATNPVFSFLSTLGSNEEFDKMYLFFPEEERAARFESLRGNRPSAEPTHKVLRTTRPNVVVILMESFARTIMDTDREGARIMPNLDRYKQEGLWFENFFANSFRTDRGEVAVLSGFPGQTNVSIMKLPGKSRNLPSIARTLSSNGYKTRFYYGGDLNFTNQASYLYDTGWQELVWQKDLHFDRPASNWGFDDEVMCDYVADRIIAQDARGERFLTGFLTLSSHTPYDVPYAKFQHKMLNAAAFSDECLGRMLDKLKASPAWDNLLIVMVADHGYPFPENLTYVEPLRYRIPMLWLGGAIERPMVIEDYFSQIDICASVLAQMDLPHSDFEYSKDIFSPSSPRFAYYAFEEGFGVVDSTGVAVWDGKARQMLRETAPSLADKGRTMLQTTYRDLSRR